MVETGIHPDFITIDGAEGGTGAAPPEFSNSVGTPLVDGLTLVNNTLIGAGLRDDIKIIASGRSQITALAPFYHTLETSDWAGPVPGFCLVSLSCAPWPSVPTPSTLLAPSCFRSDASRLSSVVITLAQQASQPRTSAS